MESSRPLSKLPALSLTQRACDDGMYQFLLEYDGMIYSKLTPLRLKLDKAHIAAYLADYPPALMRIGNDIVVELVIPYRRDVERVILEPRELTQTEKLVVEMNSIKQQMQEMTDRMHTLELANAEKWLESTENSSRLAERMDTLELANEKKHTDFVSAFLLAGPFAISDVIVEVIIATAEVIKYCVRVACEADDVETKCNL